MTKPKRGFTAFTVAATLACSARAATEWNANADFKANEDSGALELLNPNGAVPEWSYGYRGTLVGPSITLFGGAANHFNSMGNANFQGWAVDSAGMPPWVVAHVGTSTEQIFAGVDAVTPNEVAAHPGQPGSGSDYVIARWTAPASGNYDVTAALWRDLHTGNGNGQEVAIVSNAAALFHQTFPGNGSAGIPSPISLALVSGQFIDFVLGANGDFQGDTTGFQARIQFVSVPEPSSAALLTVGLIGLSARRRRGRTESTR